MSDFAENRTKILYEMSVPIEEAFNEIQDAMAIAAANKEFLMLEMLSVAFSDIKRALYMNNDLMEISMSMEDSEKAKLNAILKEQEE